MLSILGVYYHTIFTKVRIFSFPIHTFNYSTITIELMNTARADFIVERYSTQIVRNETEKKLTECKYA